MAKMDVRSLINNNLQTIASQWHINIQDLIDDVPVPEPNLADKLDDLQKHNISFKYEGARLWNNSDSYIKFAPSIATFKQRYLKDSFNV